MPTATHGEPGPKDGRAGLCAVDESRVRLRRNCLLLLTLALLPAAAQSDGARPQPDTTRALVAPDVRPQDTRLSTVIAAFLLDAGQRAQGLPWTTGDELAVEWESAAPVANEDAWSLRQGLTLVRTARFTGRLGDTVALPMILLASGNETGIQRVAVTLPSMLVERPDGSGFFLTNDMVAAALVADGMAFQPLKCSRQTEGASYGNVVEAVQVQGKVASGIWWFWQSPQQAPTLTLTLLYRRADMTEAECAGGAP